MKFSTIEHKNFLFDIGRICSHEAEIYYKFSILLSLGRYNEGCISEESKSSKCGHRGKIVHDLFSKVG